MEFLTEFDTLFGSLENLPLTKAAENGAAKANSGGAKNKAAQYSKTASQIGGQAAQAQKNSAQKPIKNPST